MDKKLSVLNLVLLLTAGILITGIIRIWSAPEYPSRVDVDSLTGSPKSLKDFSANRKTYSSSLISNIVNKNLFRKERAEFKVAASTQPSGSKIVLPSPEITVRGIMLLSNLRRVVLEGSYYIVGKNNQPEAKPIKKKSYELKDFLGDYQIIEINKNSITLKGSGGNKLTRSLARKSLTPILREANLLYYKKKKKEEEKESAATAPANLQPQKIEEASPRVAQNKTQNSIKTSSPSESSSVEPVHVSGVKQKPFSRPSRNISGVKTNPSQPRKLHVSGR